MSIDQILHPGLVAGVPEPLQTPQFLAQYGCAALRAAARGYQVAGVQVVGGQFVFWSSPTEETWERWLTEANAGR